MASLGRLRDYLSLMRPGNAVMAAVGAATGFAIVSEPGVAPDLALVLAVTLPPLLIAAFGNVVNDVSDVAVDRVAHPHRPLPSGRIRALEAWVLAALLLLTGLAWTQDAGFPAFALAGLNALLLGLYEARLKSKGLAGNALVGVLVGSTFLYGAIAATGVLPRHPMLWLLAGMATLANVARELLKDAEDVHADRAHRATFPLRHGVPATNALAAGLVAVAVLASVLAYAAAPPWWPPWLIVLALADAVFLVGAALAWSDVGLAQRLLKLAMVVALAAFLAGALGQPG